jgi:hypothetical protein
VSEHRRLLFQHISQKKRWPCEIKYEISAEKCGGLSEKFIENQRLWSVIERRHSCGLCALKKLNGFNSLKSLKIVGRGAPLKMKVENVRLLKYALSLLDENLPDVEYYRKIKAAYKKRFGNDCTPQNCYYTEFFNLS